MTVSRTHEADPSGPASVRGGDGEGRAAGNGGGERRGTAAGNGGGEGPRPVWGRSTFMVETFPTEMPPQYPLMPILRGRSRHSNSTFPK